MKAAELIKIFRGLQGRPIKITIGSSEQIIVPVSIQDLRKAQDFDNKESVSITCNDGTKVWAASISKIEFINEAHKPEVLTAPGTKAFCKHCKGTTAHHDEPGGRFLICNICGL